MTFSPDLYEIIRRGCQESAARVVPRVMELLSPSSVIDVGGGEGWWARAFFDAGCGKVLLVDSSVEEPGWERSEGERTYTATNLDLEAELITNDLSRFDLAVCLEVAEHVTPDAGDRLVRVLVDAARSVLFSAAIPGQGGSGHVNEQWPGYWVDRFAAAGLACSDALRWEIWDDDRVEPWYRQNLLLFAPAHRLGVIGMPAGHVPDVVHPAIFDWRLRDIADLKERKR